MAKTNIYRDDKIIRLGNSLEQGYTGVTNPQLNPPWDQNFGLAIRGFYTTTAGGVGGGGMRFRGISSYYYGPESYNSGLTADTIEGAPTTNFAVRCGNHDPTVVIVELGTNDSVASLGSGPYTTNVNALLTKLTVGSNYKSGIPPKEIVWLGVEFNTQTLADVNAGNAIISARCAAFSTPSCIVNFYDPTIRWLAAGHAIPDTDGMTWDGRHFTQVGMAFMSANFLADAITLHQEKRS